MKLSDLEIAERLEEYNVPDNIIYNAVLAIQNFRKLGGYVGRNNAVNLAKLIFVKTGVEKNITKAFEMLMNILDADYPITINRNSEYRLVKKIVLKTRPECPDCGEGMSLWQVNNSDKNQVGGNYKTQWICPDEMGCGYQGDYSELTIEEQGEKYG